MPTNSTAGGGRKRRRRKQRGGSVQSETTSQPAGSGAANAAGESADDSGLRTYPLNFASPFLRLYAFLVDALILYAIIVVAKQALGERVFSPTAAPQDIIILFGYFVLATGVWGRTPGKWVAGIVVVDTDGHKPGVAVAIPREIAGKVVSYAAVGLGLAWMVFDKDRQGWHDKIAGTFVVSDPDRKSPAFMRKILKIEPDDDPRLQK